MASKWLQHFFKARGTKCFKHVLNVFTILVSFTLCKWFQVSLRRQQVSERLNEWAVFSEKNKELCEWLTQMESKVSQNGDILIEEMIEKLKKVWCALIYSSLTV